MENKNSNLEQTPLFCKNDVISRLSSKEALDALEILYNVFGLCVRWRFRSRNFQ